MPSGYRVVDGEALCTDDWDGYPVQRRRFAAALDGRAGSAVVVSGDVHSNWAALVCDDDGRAVAADLVTTAVSATAMGEQLPEGWRTLAERLSDQVEDMVWNDLEHHGYLKVDIRPDVLRGDWIAAEPGEDPLRPRVIGSWEVRPERPVVLRPATPSSSLSSFHDVLRPGLPVGVLPSPERRPDARSSFRARSRRAVTWSLLGVGLVVGALLVRARRRRR
jgi:hypothetical protein